MAYFSTLFTTPAMFALKCSHPFLNPGAPLFRLTQAGLHSSLFLARYEMAGFLQGTCELSKAGALLLEFAQLIPQRSGCHSSSVRRFTLALVLWHVYERA